MSLEEPPGTDGPPGRGPRPALPGGPASPPGRRTGAATGGRIGDALAGFLVGLIVAVLAQSAWIGAHHGRSDSLGALLSGTIGLWVGLAGAPLWTSRTSGHSSLRRDFGLRLGIIDIPLGALVGVAAQYGLSYVVYLPWRSNARFMRQVSQPAQHIAGLAHGGGVILLVLVLVVGAPVVEELFFRGLLLKALRERIGPAGAVLASAGLFGLAHFEPRQLPVLALFGVVLGLLALRTGRLGASICAHAAFNALAVYSLLR